MNTFLKVLVFLAILIAALIGGVYYYVFQAGDSEPLEQFIPADSFSYIEISNTRQSALELALNPHNEAILEVGKITGALVLAASGGPKQIDFNQLDYEALSRSALPLNRQVSFWVPNIDWNENKPRLRLPMMIAHFQGDPEAFEEDLRAFTDSLSRATRNAEIKADFNWSKSEWNGFTIRKLNVSGGQELPGSPVDTDDFNPSWTLWEGRLVASLSEKSLKDYLRSLNSGESIAAMSRHEAYQRAKENDLIAMMDLPSIIKGIEKLQAHAAATSGFAPLFPINEFLEATGILELDTISYGLDVSDSDLQVYASLSFNEDKGMVSLIENTGRSPLPEFVPQGTDFSNSVNLDFGELALFIKELVVIASPDFAPTYETYKLIADQYLGRDVEELLRSVFASEMHFFYEFETSEHATDFEKNTMGGISSQVFALGLDDAQPLKDLVSKSIMPLVNDMPQMLSEREVEGQKYIVLKTPGSPNTPVISFIVRDDYALISMDMSEDSTLFKQTIELLSGGQPGLFQEPSIAGAIDSNSPNLVGTSLVDIEKYISFIKSLVDIVSAQARANGETAVANAIESINWNAFDSLAAYGITTTSKTEHELTSRSRIVQK